MSIKMYYFVSLLPALTALVKAAPEGQRCYTQVMNVPPPYHHPWTSWHTHWTPCTLTSTKTLTTTITPRTKTTITTTTTDIVYEASTVPAPATFTPVQSSLPGSTYNDTSGNSPVPKRRAGVEIFGKRSGPQSLCPSEGKPRYPHGVSCYTWTHSRCATHFTTSTKTVLAQTRTKVITQTATTTSTSYTTTLYAACATNNLANSYQSQAIGEVTGGFTSVYDTNTTSAYQCCVSAITLNDTSVWAFEPSPFSGEGANCFIGQTGDSCPAPATNPSTAESGFGDLVVGNSFCGEIDADVPIVSSSAAAAARAARRTAVLAL